MEFVMSCGISGSGKSTWGAGLGYTVVDSDEIRAHLWGNAEDQQHPEKVFEEMFTRTINALSNGNSVYYCATNLNFRKRMNTLAKIKKHFPDITYRCVVFNTPIEICKRRNAMRSRHVLDEVIDRQVRQFHCPVKNEGWDKIEIVCTEGYDEKELSEKIWNDVKNFGSQENPHHTLTLCDHMLKAIELVNVKNLKIKEQEMVLAATGIHDIGKAYTKSYDEAGIAHYYGHENYSAYLAMNMKMPLQVVQLVNYHMVMYQKSARTVWKERLGKEMWKLLKLIYEADSAAK